MGLDKAIAHGKEHRKQYGRYRRWWAPSCCYHGLSNPCPYCFENRMFFDHKEREKANSKLKEWEKEEER